MKKVNWFMNILLLISMGMWGIDRFTSDFETVYERKGWNWYKNNIKDVFIEK